MTGRHDGPVDDLETLRRWEEFGAVWEVTHRTADRVTLSLRTCDGGEEVSRLVSDDPRLLEHVDRRSSGEDVPTSEADHPGGHQREGHQDQHGELPPPG